VNVCLSFFIPILSLTGHPAILSSVAAAAGLCVFFAGFHLLARKRLLLSAPTSEIRTAALGPVEVAGVAGGPYTITAPITGRPCFLYRTIVWQQREGKKKKWEKVADETLHLPFFLEDSAGQLLIEPLDAELDLRRDFCEEYDAAFPPPNFLSLQQANLPPCVHAFLSRHGIVPARRLRIEEILIEPNDELFAAGTLTENPGIHVRPLAPRGDPAGNDVSSDELSNNDLPNNDLLNNDLSRNNSASDSSLSGGVPRKPVRSDYSMALPVPQVILLSSGAAPTATREMSQQAKIAAALHRAGIAKPSAWSTAAVPEQNVASEKNAPAAPAVVHDFTHNCAPNPERLSEERLREAGSKPARPNPVRANEARTNETRLHEVPPVRADYNLAPPEVLMKGAYYPAFVISFRSQKEFAGPLAWKSAVMIWTGAGITLFALYMLWTQMGPL